MAGRKQHIIPQHFQRAFEISDARGRIWLYRRGVAEPKGVSISDAAAQRHFYSEPSMDGLPTLDDLITNYEKTLKHKVNQVRSLQIGDEIPAERIAEVATHLSIRSSYLRGMVEGAAIAMADAINSTARGQLNGEKLRLPMQFVPDPIQKLIVEEFEGRYLSGLIPAKPETVARTMYFALRESADEFLSKAQDVIGSLMSNLAAGSEEMSRTVQTRVLSETLAPKARIERLKELLWTIEAAPPEGAILPDCTSLAFDGKRWTSLLLASSEDIELVVLPIAPSKLAVGRRLQEFEIDLSDFNQIAAAASHSFFLASERHDSLDGTISELGGQVRAQIGDLTSSAMAEVIGQYIPRFDDSEGASSRDWRADGDSGSYSFSVNFYDCYNGEFAEAVVEELKAIIFEFSKHLPVSGLRGFVIAFDYPAALNSVERGFEPSTELSPTENANHIGVGMPLSVLDDGELKTVVVLRASVAEDIISEDEAVRGEAVQIIVHMLASAALTTLMRNKFPKQMLKPIEDAYEGTLYVYSNGVFNSYFCASISINSDQMLDLYQGMASRAFHQMAEKIPSLRSQFLEHQDMDRLFPESAHLIGEFLLAVARYIGCLKCREEEPSQENELYVDLTEYSLAQWLKLFQADLVAFDEGLESWGRFEEIFFVNRHLERIALHFGLLPEPSEIGGAYIHVRG